MNQNIWGPHLWFSLHTISFTYPLKPTNEDKINYKNFFLNLQNMIPCSVCKKNYKRHLKEHPIDNFLENRKLFVYWVIDMHNMVNGEIGKKILSYDTVIKKYEDVYNKKIIFEKNTKNKYDLLSENDNENDNENNTNNLNNSMKKTDYIKIVYGLFFIFILLLFINLLYLINKNK
jgi:hypothetical protein